MNDRITIEEPAASSEISLAIDTVKHEVASFDKISAAIAALRKDYPVDVIVDVATTAGMKSAIVARAAYRDPRLALERARKGAKAPVLELGKNIDKLAGDIEQQLRVGEDWYDKQIKTHEELRAAQKAEAEAKEAERIKAIHARIALTFSTRAMRAAHANSEVLRTTLESIEGETVSEDVYAEFTEQASEAKDEAVTAIRTLLLTVMAAEQEAERQRQIAAENARKTEELRKQQEDFERQQRRHRDEIERGAREVAAQQEADRKARQDELDKIAAEQKRLDDAKREEANRLAAIERTEQARLAAVERRRLDDEAAEQRRIKAEEEAKVRAKQEEELSAARAELTRQAKAAERARKKLAQMQKLAPRLLAQLKLILLNVDFGEGQNELYDSTQALIIEAEEGEPS